MSDEFNQTDDDEVRRDGLAMIGILLLSITLIIYVGYNVL